MHPTRELTLSHTSWFRIPEQGMTRYEPLSRGSCFWVSSVAGHEDDNDDGDDTGEAHSAAPGQAHLLCSGHVAYPPAFPRYYQHLDWLSFVKPEHVMQCLDVVDDEGLLILRWPLAPRARVAGSGWDVAELYFAEEQEDTNKAGPPAYAAAGPTISGTGGYEAFASSVAAHFPGLALPSPLRLGSPAAAPAAAAAAAAAAADHLALLPARRTEVVSHGYELREEEALEADEEGRMVPTQKRGSVLDHTAPQHGRTIVETAADGVTLQGMCGGPLVLASDPRVCVGLLESLVPVTATASAGAAREGGAAASDMRADDMAKKLSGCSLFASAAALRSFLREEEV